MKSNGTTKIEYALIDITILFAQSLKKIYETISVTSRSNSRTTNILVLMDVNMYAYNVFWIFQERMKINFSRPNYAIDLTPLPIIVIKMYCDFQQEQISFHLYYYLIIWFIILFDNIFKKRKGLFYVISQPWIFYILIIEWKDDSYELSW